MAGPFDDETSAADAADRARGRNDIDSTHIDKDAKLKLVSYVTRVERIAEERDALGEDIKEIIAEAKAAGFDAKIIREVIRRRKKSKAEIEEHDTMLELYEGVFG
jgi:uncharacterized protein (UPF0335 family)